ncbi:MAG: hypothetical protein IT186_09645 [Acidobacteria bacterium]|nr:hypothetical protein [Acidobacteriota bacterium]
MTAALRLRSALERIAAELPDDADFAPADLVAVTLNRAPLDAYRSRTERVLEQAKAELDPSKQGSAAAAKATAEAAFAEHLKRMQGPALRYEEFRKATSRWEAKRGAILGNDTQAVSVVGLRRQITDLDELPERLRQLAASRRAKADEIHRAILGLAGVYRGLRNTRSSLTSSS